MSNPEPNPEPNDDNLDKFKEIKEEYENKLSDKEKELSDKNKEIEELKKQLEEKNGEVDNKIDDLQKQVNDKVLNNSFKNIHIKRKMVDKNRDKYLEQYRKVLDKYDMSITFINEQI